MIQSMVKKAISLLLAAVLLLLPMTLMSCGKDKNNLVRITVENFGDILIELDPKAAPITVENFKKLVSEGFYDGIIFHRIVPGFVIQGGDPEGTGFGGSKEKIKGEFAANGVDNPISHERGVISMARAQDPNSASSQFFIVLSDSAKPSLDGKYAAFGKVIEGMDVVDAIAAVECIGEQPITPVVIKSAVLVSDADQTS